MISHMANEGKPSLPPPSAKFSEFKDCMSPLTLPRVRRAEVGDSHKLCSLPSVPGVDEMLMQHFSGKWLKKLFLAQKKEKCSSTVIVEHLILSAAR